MAWFFDPHKGAVLVFPEDTVLNYVPLESNTALLKGNSLALRPMCNLSPSPPSASWNRAEPARKAKGGTDTRGTASAPQGAAAEPGSLTCSCYSSTATTDLEAPKKNLPHEAGADAAGAAAASACARRRAAVFRMRAASIPAPKPLSMLTTDTPGEDAVSAASSGVIPCNQVEMSGKEHWP